MKGIRPSEEKIRILWKNEYFYTFNQYLMNNENIKKIYGRSFSFFFSILKIEKKISIGKPAVEDIAENVCENPLQYINKIETFFSNAILETNF